MKSDAAVWADKDSAVRELLSDKDMTFTTFIQIMQLKFLFLKHFHKIVKPACNSISEI